MTKVTSTRNSRPQWSIRKDLAQAAANIFSQEPKNPAEKAAKDFLAGYAEQIGGLIKKSSDGNRVIYSNALEESLDAALEQFARYGRHPEIRVGKKSKYLDLLLENEDFCVAIEVKGSNEFDPVAAAMMEFFLAVKANATIVKKNANITAANTRFLLVCMCGNKNDNWFPAIAGTLFPDKKVQVKLLTLFREKYETKPEKIAEMFEPESNDLRIRVLETFEWIYEHLVQSKVANKPDRIRKS